MADLVTIANAVGWGISILGWVVSPIISRLVSKGLDYLGATGSSATNLQTLEKKLGHLKLMLEAAEAVPPGGERAESLERWVKDLKSAFYDAEDILDEIDYHSLHGEALMRRQSVNTTKQKATAKKDSKLPPGTKDSLRKTLKEIEKLIDEGQTLLPLRLLTTSGDNTKGSPEQTMGSGSPSKTTSEPPKVVFGGDEDAKKIISILHDDTAADHSVIGIHGISGSGKTTLAQNVIMCEKNSGVPYFELFMWIHVTKNFSVHSIYNEMLEMVLGRPQKHKFSNLDMLQSELKKSLKGKRFLLVLDDVWYPESVNEKNALEKLLSPLKEANKVSRVLVTTRSADAAKFLGAQNPMPISDMSEEEFFKMFMHYALANSTVSDQSNFETVGKKIAALLRRSPLAARTVAGQLRIRTSRAEDIGFWIDTLERKSDLLNDTIMGPLWWSYHQLQEPVRQCFAYCSLFPRRYELRRDELVKMWMAQGFVDTSKNSDMEVAARECFEVLLSTSFIQPKREIAGEDEEYCYTVHDLLHDLAERVAGSDCFRIENEMMDHKTPQNVRHLFIYSNNNLGELMDQILKLDTLRTLFVLKITTKEFKHILKDLKKLRFVHVRLGRLEANVLPDCIGELKHLRYLGITGFVFPEDFIILPPTFTKLYHLQGISVPWACGNELRCSDSNHMADLKNLRWIEGPSLSIPDIGRMQWLQTLNAFTVKKEKGYEITQLEKVNIHGELRIRGLVNIQSKEEARRANLSNKLHISKLILNWKSYDDDDVKTGSSSAKKQKTARHHTQVVTPEPEEILEALHPPALLVDLWIQNYGGSTFPSWLSGEDGKLKHLKRLCFHDWHGSGSQLKFTKPIPELHSLEIKRCSWNALPDIIEQLASLQELYVYHCPNIQSLPGLPSSLKKLVIYGCPNIQSLPGLPSSLKKLVIYDFPNVKTLPELPPSLEELRIKGCPNIKTLLKLPPSLEELQIEYCLTKIQSPPGLPSSLKKLQIKGCPNIKTLPKLPPSLEELKCNRALMESYPDREGIGRIKNKSRVWC